MSTFPVTAVMEAMTARLEGDATLVGMLAQGPNGENGVYNETFDDVPTPHLVLSFVAPQPRHTLGGATVGLGWGLLIDVHVISHYEGERETLLIGERVIGLLNFATFTIAGWPTAHCAYQPGAGNWLPKLATKVDKDKRKVRDWPIEFLVTVHQG